jgi:hypothetical protein
MFKKGNMEGMYREDNIFLVLTRKVGKNMRAM